MRLSRRSFLQGASAAAGGMALGQSPAAEPPNIVLILADDMGFSDIACYGSEIATPNLDRLAAQGARFSQFYSCARCCPSRASLLTGLYPHQAGIGQMVDALALVDRRTISFHRRDGHVRRRGRRVVSVRRKRHSNGRAHPAAAGNGFGSAPSGPKHLLGARRQPSDTFRRLETGSQVSRGVGTLRHAGGPHGLTEPRPIGTCQGQGNVGGLAAVGGPGGSAALGEGLETIAVSMTVDFPV
jgi:hypothetical protein